MAHYEHLPIYLKAMEVAVYFENTVRHFSRYHKYTLGTELREVSRDIVKRVIKANSSRSKLPELLALRERLEELKLLIRITREAGGFKSFNAFQHAIEGTVSISKQNEGWIRSQSAQREKA